MPRRRTHIPITVLFNGRIVGRLLKTAAGALTFQYQPEWISQPHAIPVSLSLPLREDPFRGPEVGAVFENLLPDSEALRRGIAEKVGARGTDAYSLLSEIGRDCVGALQFLPEDGEIASGHGPDIQGEIVTDQQIEAILKNLARAPLGLGQDSEFRISVAGAQEKTALLFYQGKWWKPHGTTPTTHILKKQIGRLQNGIDLSNSVENEFYCLKLMSLFGLPVTAAEMRTFGDTKALVVERFDRRWTNDGKLIRLPQEDMCQALAVHPAQKYQSQGGPGMVDVLELLKGSDIPAEDFKRFLKAQVLFWLIGATDGHAKNFSVFLGAGGRFRMTPLYDVLTAQPSLRERQVERKQMRLAMSVGGSRHYRMDEIAGRHFVQAAQKARIATALAREVLDEVAGTADAALDAIGKQLPPGFPEKIHVSVKAGIQERLNRIAP